ncbi:MAG: phosphate acyltransferase PlsX [Firmicutes bacterium]|nr:phosphate acyltransferase PlsX [Candidatus Fermentithermobacillaceae bacterium]
MPEEGRKTPDIVDRNDSPTSKFRIALDLMGGDVREAALEGCLEALAQGINVVPVGDEASIENLKARATKVPGLTLEDVDFIVSKSVISPSDAPVRAIRGKPDSSIVLGLTAVKEGRAHAFVSAGSTGALVAGGVLILGRAEGVEKPGLGTVLPSSAGRGVFFIDLGASVDCRPENIVEFAVMGHVYASAVLGWSNPPVALLNVGVEQEKGNLLSRKAFELLSRAPINFQGNIEARDVFALDGGVVVCDGFTGNVFLKTCEGTAFFQLQTIKREVTRDLRSKLGALLLKPAFSRVRKILDYTEYGGAPLLGLSGTVIKCHGSSGGKAIANGIRAALRCVEEDVTGKIGRALQARAGTR